MQTKAYAVSPQHLENQKHIWLLRLFTASIFAFTSIALCPDTLGCLVGHIDGQMRWALNYLSCSGYVFGKDVIFTYGPLGFILMPLDMGFNQYIATGVQLIIYGLLMLLAFCLSLRQKKVWAVFVFAIMLIICAPFSDDRDCKIELLTTVLACCPLVFPLLGSLFAVALGVLAGSTLFMKFSLGIVATILLVSSAICWYLKYGIRATQMIVCLMSAYVVTFVLLAACLFQSFDNFVLWLRGSLDLVSGYSEAVSLSGANFELATALAIISLYFIGVTYLALTKSELLLPTCLLMPIIFFAFKHSFVRQDVGHLSIFAYEALNALAFLFILTTRKRESISLLTLFIVSFFIFNSWHLDAKPTLSNLKNIILCNQGISRIKSLRHMRGAVAQQNERGNQCLKRFRLSDEVIKLIEKTGGSVDVIPQNLLYCPANDFKWKPNSIFQIYEAFTPYLESRSAAHFAGDNAPDFALVDFESMDNIFLSNPKTWRTLLTNYQIAGMDDRGVLVLSKRKKNREIATCFHTHTVGKIGQWIDVPTSEKLLYGKIKLSRSLVGIVFGLIYQVQPVYIDLCFASHKIMSYRLVPKVLECGILLNYLPMNINEVKQLFLGECHDRVVKFRIKCTGCDFQLPFDLNWYEDQVPICFAPKPNDLATYALSRKSSRTTYLSVDSLNGQSLPVNRQVVLDADDILTISGWAVDRNNNCLAQAVLLTVDGNKSVIANYGMQRSDVAEACCNANFANSGFLAALDGSELKTGRHVIHFKIISKDCKWYYQPDVEIIAIRR